MLKDEAAGMISGDGGDGGSASELVFFCIYWNLIQIVTGLQGSCGEICRWTGAGMGASCLGIKSSSGGNIFLARSVGDSFRHRFGR